MRIKRQSCHLYFDDYTQIESLFGNSIDCIILLIINIVKNISQIYKKLCKNQESNTNNNKSSLLKSIKWNEIISRCLNDSSLFSLLICMRLLLSPYDINYENEIINISEVLLPVSFPTKINNEINNKILLYPTPEYIFIFFNFLDNFKKQQLPMFHLQHHFQLVQIKIFPTLYYVENQLK